MPRKVQPYGSGDETEAAALARSRPNPAPGYVNELAATMTIGEVATQAVEAVRALNQLMADAGELTGPGEAREVVGRLALMGHQLPQLYEQLARFLVARREDGQIARGTRIAGITRMRAHAHRPCERAGGHVGGAERSTDPPAPRARTASLQAETGSLAADLVRSWTSAGCGA